MCTTPSSAQILDRVARLAAAQVGVDAASVHADTRFEEDLNYDSLEKVEFTLALETELDLTLPDADADAVRTVGQAAALVERLLQSRTA